MELIKTGLGVLEARSLPQFWVEIGMEKWIRDSSTAYVADVLDEVKPMLNEAMAEMVPLDSFPYQDHKGSIDEPDYQVSGGSFSPEGKSSSSSTGIMRQLSIMDGKLDEIRDNTRSQGSSSGLIEGTLQYDMFKTGRLG